MSEIALLIISGEKVLTICDGEPATLPTLRVEKVNTDSHIEPLTGAAIEIISQQPVATVWYGDSPLPVYHARLKRDPLHPSLCFEYLETPGLSGYSKFDRDLLKERVQEIQTPQVI